MIYFYAFIKKICKKFSVSIRLITFVLYEIQSLKKMSVTTTSIPFDLDDIYDSIVEDKCVLVLGPNFYADTRGTHQARLLDFFNKKNVAYQRYYEEEGFFLFNEVHERTFAWRKIKKFYKDIQPNEQLHKIAQIPFHIYLTVTPDKLLNQAFVDLNYQTPQIAHYKKNTNPQEITAPTANNPLIYNAFGILDDNESIILTHDDLYDYFKSIFSRRSMPEKVRTTLNDAANIIFLGVPFQKWYMHLLLREFGAHENKKIIRFAADQATSDEIRTFCYQQFKIHFIEHDITDFVSMLYRKFKEENELRNNSTTPDRASDEMKKRIGEGKLREAIEMLKKHTAGTDLNNEIIATESRWNKYKEAERNTLLNPSELKVERAQIVKALTDFIDLIEI